MQVLDHQVAWAEQKFTIWNVEVDPATKITDLLQKEFWSQVGRKLRRGAILHVMHPEDKYDVTLRVVAAGNTWARVRILSAWTPEMALESERVEQVEPDYKIEFTPGGNHKWRVRRLGDNAIMNKGMNSKVEAQQWLANFLSRPIAA